ncbi:MAG: 16S rRNA (adenine(1518)-N(6)/adenine(1519)-N(6))-dimethyltransferase RsmA [Gemmatimonadota bacterium]
MTRPKRSLSQNFLVDHNIRRKLVAELGAGPGDEVLEVGPGHGELSELLVGEVARLVLVEKDDRLAPELASRWADRDDVVVVHGDAMEVDLARLPTAGLPLRIISNVPYSITSPLLFRLLDIGASERIVVLVQEEVARRITANPGGKEYGALTVGIQTQARAEYGFGVGRNVFRPVPRVDSAAVVLTPFPPRAPGEQTRIRNLARAAFSRRRKQIRTILRTAPEYELDVSAAESLLADLGIAPTARPESLSPDVFVELARRLPGAAPPS